jgi:hypothetical protein
VFLTRNPDIFATPGENADHSDGNPHEAISCAPNSHSTAALSTTTPATVRQQLALLHRSTTAAGPRCHVHRKRGRGTSVPLRQPQGVPAPGGPANIAALVNDKRRALGHGSDGAPRAALCYGGSTRPYSTSTRLSAAEGARGTTRPRRVARSRRERAALLDLDAALGRGGSTRPRRGARRRRAACARSPILGRLGGVQTSTPWRMMRDTDAVRCADALQCISYMGTADQILFT